VEALETKTQKKNFKTSTTQPPTTETKSPQSLILKLHPSVHKGFMNEIVTEKNSRELSNNEIGIIIACTAGVFILGLMITLALMCYRNRRYGTADVSKRKPIGVDIKPSHRGTYYNQSQFSQMANKVDKNEIR